jgi:hypothetical protein
MDIMIGVSQARGLAFFPKQQNNSYTIQPIEILPIRFIMKETSHYYI